MADNRQALDALHHLSMEVGRTVEDSNFRFAASHAYASVLRARLARLDEVSIGELTTFERYLENRIEPAITTLSAIEKRLTALTDTDGVGGTTAVTEGGVTSGTVMAWVSAVVRPLVNRLSTSRSSVTSIIERIAAVRRSE